MRFIEYMTGAALVAALAYGGCAAGRDDVGAGDPPRGTDSGDPGSEVAVPADDSGDPTTDDTGTVAVEDTPPKTLDYPGAPYGKTVGATIPNLKYKGYRDGVGDWTDIAMLDYYDPDGSRGIKAIKIEMAAVWCGVCNSEAGRLTGVYPGFKSRGARFVTAMIQNASRGPADKSTVDGWIARYKCNYDVIADPTMSLAPPTGGTIGLPYVVIIDPRTMKIANIFQGDGPSIDTAINALIAKNGG